MKKLTLLALVLILVLTACGSNSNSVNNGNTAAKPENNNQGAKAPEDEAPKEKVKITLMHWWAYMTDEVIAEFEKANPDIEVDNQFVAPGQGYQTKVQSLASTNQLPDVIGLNVSIIAPLLNQQKMLNVNEALNTTEAYDTDKKWIDTQSPVLMKKMIEDTLNQNIEEANKPSEDKTFSLPFSAISVAVVYNKTVFEKVGIEAPTTWEQFMDNNDKLKAAGYIPLAHAGKIWNHWWISSFLDQTARDVTKADWLEGKVDFNDPRIKEAFEIKAEMVEREHFDKGAVTAAIEDASALFVQERAAQFMIVPENFVTYLHENVPEGVEVDSFVLPGAKGLPSRSIGGSGMVGISADTKHQEAAIKLVKFLTSNTVFNLLADQNVVPSTMGYEPPADNPIMKSYAEAYANGFSQNILPPMSSEGNDELRSVIISSILIGTSAEEAVEKAQELWEKDPSNPN